MGVLLNKSDLLGLIYQAVSESGWSIIYLSKGHPFNVKVFRGSESYQLRILLYNITHGGNHRARNEYRIQIMSPVEMEYGIKVLILGYQEKLGVFAGWDASKHKNPKYSASFQIKEENLEHASIKGLSLCDKGNEEVAVAFTSGFFMEYVRNLEVIHEFGRSKEDFFILEEVIKSEIEPNQEVLEKVSKQRRKALIAISQRQRDNSFRARVLRAYNNRCAFSGIQLRLVDASHIVPVSADGSTDETSNGIALSSIHHRAYDKGYITFNRKYHIITKEEEIGRLREFNLAGGLDKFLSDLRPIIDVPPSVPDRPNVNYIEKANQLRGW